MNRTWRKGAALVLIAALAIAACSKKDGGSGGGKEAPASDFSVEITADGRGVRITRYLGKGGNVVIPATIEDMPVLEIGRDVFRGSGAEYVPLNAGVLAITSVIIPDSVEIIGDQAFRYSGRLTKVNLPASLKTLSDYAFSSCFVLEELIIPDSLSSLTWGKYEEPPRTFSRCEKMPLRTQARLKELGYTGGF